MTVGASGAGADGATLPQGDEPRLKRLTMRSWRRGMRETDLLLGPFADAELPGMSAADRDLYEALLEENDQDLYAWIVAASVGRDAAPERFRRMVARIAGAAAARLDATTGTAASR